MYVCEWIALTSAVKTGWLRKVSRQQLFLPPQVKSEYVEPYLVHKCSDPDSPALLTFMDLLCKFYEKAGRYGDASDLLARLADIEKWVLWSYNNHNYYYRLLLAKEELFHVTLLTSRVQQLYFCVCFCERFSTNILDFSVNVDLRQRVSYLTQAAVCAKSACRTDEHNISMLTDKLEVTRTDWHNVLTRRLW